jgi:hypothetical protein
MAIHEQLPRIDEVELQQVGWIQATELAKVPRRDSQSFDCATWLDKARELPKDEIKREVSKHLPAANHLNLVAEIDLSSSVATKGHVDKTEFEKNLALITCLLSEMPANSRETVMGSPKTIFLSPSSCFLRRQRPARDISGRNLPLRGRKFFACDANGPRAWNPAKSVLEDRRDCKPGHQPGFRGALRRITAVRTETFP